MPAPRSGSPRARRSGPPPGRLRMPSICAYDTSKRGWLDTRRQEDGIRPPTAGLAAPAIGSFVRPGCRQNHLARSAKASRFPIRPSSKQQRKRPNPMLRHPSLRRRIVLPFIVLVVFVGAVGIAVVSAQVGGSVEGAVDNSLVRSSLRSNDRLAGVENDRLQQLRAATNTSGIDTVVARGDAAAAARLLGPIVGNAQPEHLVLRVLNGSGRQLVGLDRTDATVQTFADGASYTSQGAVQHAQRGDRDALGDKYLFVTRETPAMVYWVAPILTETQTPAVAGVVLLGQSLAEIAQTITGSSSVAVGFYDLSGPALASSLAGSPSLSSEVRHQVTPDTPVRVATQWDSRPYRLLVNDWTMRGVQLGYLGAGVPADDLSGSLNAIRFVLVALFGAIALGTIAIGLVLADGLHLSEADLVVLRRAGLLHDVGKIGVSDKILSKPGPLNDEEWDAIRRHPVIGFDMLKDVPFLQPSLDPIRHHHERWDGEGYPDGLKGASISQLARVVTLADAFDAMTSDRPYRKGFSFEFAARTIMSEAGRQFDPAVVEAFKAKKAAIFARLEEMGKRPTPHASDIRLDSVAC